jgi:leucine dehydrogenase
MFSELTVTNHPEFDHHEQVVFCHDEESGLRAIIAVHNTNLGPAAGGCRMWPYASLDEALTDALRLSRAMSYKNAMAGLPLGGGKSVIIGDPRKDKSEALFEAFGAYVQGLKGSYYVAEDVGISVEDIEVVGRRTDYVFGVADGFGDPSPVTAQGCFNALKAAVKFVHGDDSLEGIRVAVQGVGHVGYHYCKLLHEAGAELRVADIHEDAVTRAVQDFGAQAVAPQTIYAQNVDVFAPCALGGILNEDTIPQLKAGIVCGAANNQLMRAEHGYQLQNKSILYLPDYVVNAGGMLGVAGDILHDYTADDVQRRVSSLYNTTLDILASALEDVLPPFVIANKLARARIGSMQLA